MKIRPLLRIHDLYVARVLLGTVLALGGEFGFVVFAEAHKAGARSASADHFEPIARKWLAGRIQTI